MSWAEDNMIDIDPEDLAIIRANVSIWETIDGKLMAIEDMSTNHIENCIKKILKSIKEGRNWRVSYLAPLREELLKRDAPLIIDFKLIKKFRNKINRMPIPYIDSEGNKYITYETDIKTFNFLTKGKLGCFEGVIDDLDVDVSIREFNGEEFGYQKIYQLIGPHISIAVLA